MIKKLLLAIVIMAPCFISAQTLYETFSSEKLGEDRRIKIQLPRNYEKNKEMHYPIAVVLDGDYLFEPVAGLLDYYAYWEDAPEMIIVGINQSESRQADSFYDQDRNLPSETGAAFFEFLGMELMVHISEKYRVAPFNMIVGHDLTANFMNYYLLKPDPIFDAYINLSPDYDPQMAGRLLSVLQKRDSNIWYYLASATDDIPQLHQSISDLDRQIKKVNNNHVHYQFDEFQGATHYTLVGKAVPSAIDHIFEVYRPISQQEYEKVLLQTSISLSEYLQEKYHTIEELFGVSKQIRINDFLAINKAIEKTRRWQDFKDLSKMAEEEYPGTMLGNYFEARYEEEVGSPERAMKIYQKAYGKKSIAFLDTDFMLEKANEIKNTFGY